MADLINARENFKDLPDNKTGLRVYDDSEYLVNDYDKASTTVEYIGKSNLSEYRIELITQGAGADFTIRYATIKNNPTRLTYVDAWNNRVTLIYDIR